MITHDKRSAEVAGDQDWTDLPSWTIEKAIRLYDFNAWGGGYFSVADSGEVVIHPCETKGPAASICSILKELRNKNLRPPFLLRFPQLLANNIKRLHDSFGSSLKKYGYEARYQGVFPIKVNQTQQVVEAIHCAGQAYGYGLEAGSKAELCAVLTLHSNPDALILCNGFKDGRYLETAMLGKRLGKKVIVICEQFDEVGRLLNMAEDVRSLPDIGIRCRLSIDGTGIWQDSSGTGSKFGFSTTEILAALEELRTHKALSKLKMLHFHIGSQVSRIATLDQAVHEAARLYTQLHKETESLEYLNIGGGLAVDYDGSHTSDFSSDYSLEEYCDRIVSIVKTTCDSEEVPHPTLVSESGRFVAAHHSMLAVEVRGLDSSDHLLPGETVNGNEHSRITELNDLLKGMTDDQVRRQSRRALELQRALAEDFNRGELSLSDRAISERLFRQIAEKAHQLDPEVSGQQLQKFLRQHFVCNFSVFQSLPDNLLVKQVFPIVPLQRLDEEPLSSTTLVDITCDSDGRVDRFAHGGRNQSNLLVHSLGDQDREESYYLGFFLMGAYQDVMGDVHNLFGTANEVSVNILDNGEWEIENITEGDSCADVLGYVGYNKEDLLQRLSNQIDELGTVSGGDEKNEMITQYEELLDDQTYLGPA